MTDQLLQANIRGPLRRILTLLPLLLALLGAWYAVRWFVGNTIAENLNPEDRGLENAQLALSLAPSDPLAHWTMAELEQSKLSLDESNRALAEYEQAVRLAPNDYRFWLSWGRALEQSGDTQRGEQAMRRAVALAPSYSYPRWYLGNLLLRSGREAEAFKELRTAGEADPQLRPQIFTLAWQVYRDNPTELGKSVGSTPIVQAEFAKYLLERGQVESGMNIWRSLSAEEKQANRSIAAGSIKTLVDQHQYAQAIEIVNDFAAREDARVKVDEMQDGGFEKDSNPTFGSVFGWQMKSGLQSQAVIDHDLRRSGAGSLKLTFKARSNVDVSLSQLVAVMPGTQYEFAGYVKTSKLESAATPVIEIVDATSGAVLAASPPAPAGYNDWQRFTVAFKTDAKTTGILVRVGRASCGENTSCPIFGTLWYDDFDLKRRG